jgi:aminopeptidase N
MARLLLAALLALTGIAPCQAPESGISQPLAIARAARLSNIRYTLSFHLHLHADSTDATETLTFTNSAPGDLPLDYRDGNLTTAILNGQPISTAQVNGHLILPAAALRQGNNRLDTTFTSNVAASGKAITRYTDKDDQNEYIYTLFVPMDADMAFPCFDQPDLKARFTLTVQHPTGWTVIANTAATSTATTVSTFPETRPISTYLFAFAAGPFAQIPPTRIPPTRIPGAPSFPALSERVGSQIPTQIPTLTPTLYVRKSQLSRAQLEAPQVQAITRRGIAYLQDYFQQPFPFPKYDLVLIPGFPFGGMEHAGATFLNEDGVLFRTAPTESDYFRRNVLVLHETTHQWFGDLVTMRWFNDLWLKEGFAQYMAYHALAELEPQQNPWKHFYEDIKPLAYGIDETQGTTPIFQNIANLKDAKSAYGAIVYQKAPAVLKQLEYFLGDQTFRNGLRLYLHDHAYANAQWADLIGAFETASRANHQPKDVQSWAKAWILQRGMPQIEVAYDCKNGMVTEFTLRQHDALGTPQLWPISNLLRVYYPPSFSRDSDTYRVDWNAATTSVKEAVGHPCPYAVFANANDFAYGRFLLGPLSDITITSRLTRSPELDDPLNHSMLWGALWEDVRVAQTNPGDYVALVQKTLPTEPDESLNRIQGARLSTALHSYLSQKSREAFLPGVEEMIADRMLHAPTLGLRIVNFRTYLSIAETPAALHRLKDINARNLEIPGLTLRPLDRWNMVGHLIAQNDPEAADAYAYEKSHDKSGEGQKYAFSIAAGAPTAETKADYWNQYLHKTDLQEDWITASLGPFNAWNQSALTAPYLARALDQLSEIKLHRKIFFLGAWLNAFVASQKTPEAQQIVRTWLAKPNIDPDLRLKVLEVSDALDRTVRIRQKYPN